MLQRLDITDAEYFKLPYASNSGMKEAQKMFSAESGSKTPVAAYEFGSALDALLTNPREMNTSRLKPEERDLLFPMRRAMAKDPTYIALCSKADTQVVFVDMEFQVEVDGMTITIPAKCKYDFWQPKMYFGCDLKSTDTRDQKAFTTACDFFKYPMQGAWYMDVTRSDRFVIIGVSKRNFKVFTYSIRRNDPNYIIGRDQYRSYARPWWMLYGIKGHGGDSVAPTGHLLQ